MKTARIAGALAAALLLTTIAACTSIPDAGRQVTTPTASSSPASPSPTPSDGADPTGWAIDANGIGPLQLGMTLSEATAAVASVASPVSSGDVCPNTAIHFFGPAGATTADAPLVLAFAVDGGLVGIADSARGPSTSAGVGVGSSLADVEHAYPGATSSMRAQVDPLRTVSGDPGWISFETTADSPTAPVTLVHVVAGGPPPAEYCG